MNDTQGIDVDVEEDEEEGMRDESQVIGVPRASEVSPNLLHLHHPAAVSAPIMRIL